MTGHLIVVGSGLMQQPVYREARDMGIPTLGLDRDPNSVARRLADSWLECDISDEAACVAALRRWGGTYRGVLTVGTDFSTTVAHIAEEFGLWSHSYQAALAAKDKALMRQRLAQAGIPVPRFKVLDSEHRDFRGIDFPAVVKPVDNMGARGVRRVDTASDLEQAVQEALAHSRQGRAIVEDYIEGPEFSLDALITPKGFYRRGLADRDIHFPPYFVEMGHSFPTHAASRVQNELWDCLESSARALGLEWGAVKGDLKWHEGRPVVGEVAARLSGGFMSGWTFPLASGLSPVREAILLALGQEPKNPNYFLERSVVEGAIIGIPGTLMGWFGLNGGPVMREGEQIFFLRKTGDLTTFPRNNVEKLANVIVAQTDLEAARSRLKEYRRFLFPRLQAPHPQTEDWLSNPQQPAFRDGQDWYGIPWRDRLEDIQRIEPDLWRKLPKNLRKKVVEALEAGGIPGALYRLDCLTQDLPKRGF